MRLERLRPVDGLMAGPLLFCCFEGEKTKEGSFLMVGFPVLLEGGGFFLSGEVFFAFFKVDAGGMLLINVYKKNIV